MTANTDSFDESILAAIDELGCAGFALHLLRPRTKKPVDPNWSEAPVATTAALRAAHRSGANLGVRLGEPSQIAGGYLHLIDLDIRVADLADEAWARLRDLLPGVDLDSLPTVQSGSGGASRHLYLITDKPFRSKLLATSEGKHRRTKDGKEGWSYDWEIELFGTGKQVVVPPSIHPDTGLPYRWERPFELALLDLDIGPFVPSAAIERLSVAEHATFAFEERKPLTFKDGQLERILGDVPVSDLHYDDWIRLGQAIHHQTGGSAEGLELWLTHTRRSSKYTGAAQEREMRRIKWRSFGKYRGKPVTMATIVEWSKDARVAALVGGFDEEEPPLAENFDDILGGADTVIAGDPPEVDEIDAIGGGRPVKGQPRGVVGDWVSLLDVSEDGGIKPTLHNVELIVENDPRLAGLPKLNEFTCEVVQRTSPGRRADQRRKAAKATRQLEGPVWVVRDAVNGDLWSDDRDFAIRSILEAPGTQGGYGIKVTDRDLKAAVTLSANRSRFHPVREYLERLEWDQTRRLDRLFIDYLGSGDSSYTRSVARLMMVGAVVRIFEPGHKADHVVILESLQGKRKSTFIRVLARHWFAELDGDFHDSKQMIELMQGSWILELPELSSFRKADVRTIKAFVSRQADKARLAYARRAGEFPRQCIFIGSTNDKEYLADDTGGRRWWPVECNAEQIDTEALQRNVDQLWAEAVNLYREMRLRRPVGTLPLYLDDCEAAAEAERVQESRREVGADEVLAGRIEEWLDTPILSGDIGSSEASDLRHVTSHAQIWRECLGQTAPMTDQNTKMIGRAMKFVAGWATTGWGKLPRYGKGRIYERGGMPGRLARLSKSAANGDDDLPHGVRAA